MSYPVMKESLDALVYVEDYFDAVDNLPHDLQRHITQIRHIDVEQKASLKEVENNVTELCIEFEKFSNEEDNLADAETLEAHQQEIINKEQHIADILDHTQELSIQKLVIVKKIQDEIESKAGELAADLHHLHNFFNRDKSMDKDEDSENEAPVVKAKEEEGGKVKQARRAKHKVHVRSMMGPSTLRVTSFNDPRFKYHHNPYSQQPTTSTSQSFQSLTSTSLFQVTKLNTVTHLPDNKQIIKKSKKHSNVDKTLSQNVDENTKIKSKPLKSFKEKVKKKKLVKPKTETASESLKYLKRGKKESSDSEENAEPSKKITRSSLKSESEAARSCPTFDEAITKIRPFLRLRPFLKKVKKTTTTNSNLQSKLAKRLTASTSSSTPKISKSVASKNKIKNTKFNKDAQEKKEELCKEKIQEEPKVGESKDKMQETKVQESKSDDDDNSPVEQNDADAPKYCLCDEVSYGKMICCDNDLCPLEWFHFSCVNLLRKPKGEWYCPKCRGETKSVMKPMTLFLKELDEYNRQKEQIND